MSDPGARLVAAVREAGLRVVPLPGASSVTAVLSVAGAVARTAPFLFAGFLPAKAGERQAAVARLAQETRATVLLEAPHRIEALARSLAALGSRPVTVGRELTKQFEEIATLACSELPAWLAADPQRIRGEFALVLHAAAQAPQARRGTARAGHLVPALGEHAGGGRHGVTRVAVGLPSQGLRRGAIALDARRLGPAHEHKCRHESANDGQRHGEPRAAGMAGWPGVVRSHGVCSFLIDGVHARAACQSI